MKLLNHTKNYESNEIYHCTVCDILFDIKYRLLQHQSLSKAHQVVPVDGPSTDHPDEDSSKIMPKERKRNQSRRRVGKELTYPDAEFILCIDETPEYQVIHLGGERCCGCDMMFHSYQDLIDHCSEIHPRKDGEEATYECILCFERFDQVQSYNRHRSARVQKEIYYCQFCDVVIDIKFRFEQHLKTSVAHQSAVEKAGIKSIFPEEKPVNELRMLETHIEVLEIDGIRCCGCEFVCNSRQELEDHSEERHGFERDESKNSDEFECDICFKRFSKLGLFTCHRNLSLQRTVYRCKYCDMQSEIKYRILQHVSGSTHQIEDQKEPNSEPEPKIHNCCFVKCAITFEDPNDLLDHVEEHHASKRRENAQERESNAFICYVCHKSFKNERSLKSHQFPKKTNTQNVCSTCNASFLYLSALTNHEKMHIAGIKEYQCDICDKAFFDERALRVHKVCHNEERPYVCDVCSKSFLRKGNLRVSCLRWVLAENGVIFFYQISICRSTSVATRKAYGSVRIVRGNTKRSSL